MYRPSNHFAFTLRRSASAKYQSRNIKLRFPGKESEFFNPQYSHVYGFHTEIWSANWFRVRPRKTGFENLLCSLQNLLCSELISQFSDKRNSVWRVLFGMRFLHRFTKDIVFILIHRLTETNFCDSVDSFRSYRAPKFRGISGDFLFVLHLGKWLGPLPPLP